MSTPITPFRRRTADNDAPRYTLLAGGRELDAPTGSYVGALVHARTDALANPGVRYELKLNGETIARYAARGGKLVEAWIR